jgi:hypothetical protein
MLYLMLTMAAIAIIALAAIEPAPLTRIEDAYPSLSPDGKQLLFQSNRSGRWALYSGDPDGGNGRGAERGLRDQRRRQAAATTHARRPTALIRASTRSAEQAARIPSRRRTAGGSRTARSLTHRASTGRCETPRATAKCSSPTWTAPTRSISPDMPPMTGTRCGRPTVNGSSSARRAPASRTAASCSWSGPTAHHCGKSPMARPHTRSRGLPRTEKASTQLVYTNRWMALGRIATSFAAARHRSPECAVAH